MPQGAITLSDIQSADWSLALDGTIGGGPASGIGNVVQGLADVNQCIGIILTTPPGSDPLRPDFACNIFSFLDLPVDNALPLIVSEVTAAITKWEPRVDVLNVTGDLVTTGGQAGAQLQITVTWQLKIANAVPQQTTLIPAQYAALGAVFGH